MVLQPLLGVVEQSQLPAAFDDAEEWSKDHDAPSLEKTQHAYPDNLQQVSKV